MSVISVDDAATRSEAEQRVLEAICNRGVANFTGLPVESCLLRSTFIEDLISGAIVNSPQLCGPLRIRGACIQGPIRVLPKSGDGAGMTLLFMACHFDSPVDFSGADFLSLRLVDCTLPAFIGISLTTRADLDLSGSHFSGVRDHVADLADVGNCAVHLNHSHIGGRLLMSATAQARFETRGSVRLEGARIESSVELHGALLEDCDEAALNARSAVIGGNLELLCGHGHRCEVHGEVALGAAHVTGDLDCGSARLLNPKGRALHCEDLVVESVFLTMDEEGIPFEASGRLNFLTAKIGGSFFLFNARLTPGPDYKGLLGRGGPVVANLRQMRVSNALVLYNVGTVLREPEPGVAVTLDESFKPVEGWFMFAGAHMNTLIVHVGTGSPAAGYLDIDGMTYERIRHVDSGDLVAKSKIWLRQQFIDGRPDASTYRPQPYEQLTRVLRESGLSREADAIAVEKISMRLAARVDSPLMRLFPRLLMLISSHGYSTRRVFHAQGRFFVSAICCSGGGDVHPGCEQLWPTVFPLRTATGAYDLLSASRFGGGGCAPGLSRPRHHSVRAGLRVTGNQSGPGYLLPFRPHRDLALAVACPTQFVRPLRRGAICCGDSDPYRRIAARLIQWLDLPRRALLTDGIERQIMLTGICAYIYLLDAIKQRKIKELLRFAAGCTLEWMVSSKPVVGQCTEPVRWMMSRQ